MNTTFNFSRFLKVLSNEWRLNIKKMLLFWGAILIVTILYFVFFMFVNQFMILKTTTFAWSFFLMCILQGFYLQIYFGEFSSKTKTQALLLLPASRNETFWAKFLLGIILYLAVFSAYLWIVIKWNGIHNDWIKESKNFPPDFWKQDYYQRCQTIAIDSMTGLWFFLTWLFSSSAYLFGMMSFKKLAVLKSLVFWFMVALGLVLITYIIFALFTGVWPALAIPGLVIATDIYGHGDCVLYQIYPELWYCCGLLFICLALIFISRIKYNEKTI